MAEVFGGKSPYRPERRANAFGAEFLLPRWAARNAWRTGSGDIGETLTKLSDEFGVGKVLAAAQLKNASETGLTYDQRGELEAIILHDKEAPDAVSD